MKKIIAILLAVLMLAALAACGGEKTPETDETQQQVAVGEVHGISQEEYSTITADDLIAKLVKDPAAPTKEEFVAIIETAALAEVYENCTFADNATADALKQLKDSGATLPTYPDCAAEVLANESVVVRAFYYQQFFGASFSNTAACYEIIKTQILKETEPVAVAAVFRYIVSNYGDDADVYNYVLSFKDSDNSAVKKWFTYAARYFTVEDKSEMVDVIIKLLADEDTDVVNTAALYCGGFADDKLVEPLAAILKDESLENCHANAVAALTEMWYDYPMHENHSEKAYKATMDYFKADYEDGGLPNWQATNKLSNKNKSYYDKWLEEATYFDAEDIVETMTKLFNDESKDKLLRSQCISVIGNFGEKADLEALQATIDKVESESDKSSYQSKLDAELAKK